ncbi:hypothetical protein CBS101457_001766 [Exobasidium rhododendri]|nr:hypothetical protein CBS101457_001766 [Exobasidium rhododendri]
MSISKEQRQKLIAASQDARNLSYSPYSHFRVGAAILCKDGEIVLGANVEIASYGGAICAERTGLVKAITSGHASGSFLAIAVAADIDTPCSPCGICRQVIREFCPLDMPIYMPYGHWTKENDVQDSSVVMLTLEQLLPMSFGPEDLARTQQ